MKNEATNLFRRNLRDDALLVYFVLKTLQVLMITWERTVPLLQVMCKHVVISKAPSIPQKIFTHFVV